MPELPFPQPTRRDALVAGAAFVTLSGAARAQGLPPPRRSGPALAPIALEAPGAEQPIRVQSLRVDVEIAGGVAETRLELVVLNPNARVLEGTLTVPLGPGQTVTGFALDVDGRLRDAVPVPKARAEAVFESIVRQGIDPGLLQHVAGNRHALRLYPLPPRGTRTVALRIAEPATGRLAVPLAFAERVPQAEVAIRMPGAVEAPGFESDGGFGLAFAADRAGGWTARRSAVDALLPVAPLVVALPPARGPEVTTERRGVDAWFSAVLPLDAAAGRTAPRPLPRRLQIVWDASASMATRDRAREFALLDALCRRAGTLDVTLVRVADAAEPAEVHAVRGGDWTSLRRALEATAHDGGSRLGAVVHDGVSTEALWFTDGLSTWGAPWRPAFPVPVTAVVSTLDGDRPALARLAAASGGRLVDLAAASDADARRALLERGPEVVDVAATGAHDVLLASRHPVDGRLALAGAFDAGRRDAEVVVRVRHADGRVAPMAVRIERDRHAGRLAGSAWARLALAAVAGSTDAERARTAAIGQRFAIPTAETSLLVLERAEDYARHGIAPPDGEPALLAEVKALVAARVAVAERSRGERVDAVARRFVERTAWWSRDFARDPHVPALRAPMPTAGGLGRAGSLSRPAAEPLPPPAAPAPFAAPVAEDRSAPAVQPAEPERRDGIALRSARAERLRTAPAAAAKASADGVGAPRIAIALTPAPTDAAWTARLARAAPAERRALYLALRERHAGSVAFLLEAADWFLARGDAESRALGLAALSNVAEMDVPSRQLLRLVAYRLVQSGEPDLAVAVFERVRALAPHEPQSHRDLGLALAARDAPGDRQRALDALHAVVVGAWDARFADVEVIALAELNALAAKAAREGRPLDTASVDRRLLKNLPLDLRVVLAWDADATDVDLHVTDPDGETVSYARPLSRQGGAITRDATGGYGPEEFALRVAKPGRYRVEAVFFGHRQQVLTTSTGLMLWLSSGFGTAAQRDRRSTLRVASRSGTTVLVGEIDVGAGAVAAVGTPR